eukprot:1158418-Pelagomonas_calceolata.AAC.14
MSQTLQNLKIQAICSNYASRRALVTYIHKHVLSMDVSTTIMSMLATSTKPRRFMASGKLGALNFGSRLKQLWRKAPMALSSWGADLGMEGEIVKGRKCFLVHSMKVLGSLVGTVGTAANKDSHEQGEMEVCRS